MYDLVFQGGTVIDGTGAGGREADVAVVKDRVVRVGKVGEEEAARTIDARGLVVAPGFVDVHNHSEGWLLKLPHFAAKTTQGFTTEVLMSDGISYAPVTEANAAEWMVYLRSLNGLQIEDYSGWRSVADYLERIDRNSAQNAISQIPYANVRVLACGWGRAPADDTQLKIMRREVRDSMEAGAVGVSTGLDYIAQCFARTDEIAEVCEAMAPYSGLYVTHVRYKKGLLGGLAEAVEICRRAGVRLHISHLKLERPDQTEEVFAFLERAGEEVDLSFDMYPWGASSTMLASLLPYEAWEQGPLGTALHLPRREIREWFARLLGDYRMPLEEITLGWLPGEANRRHLGRTLAEYAAATGRGVPDALADLLIEEQLGALGVFHVPGDDHTEPLISHPLAMIGSDGIYQPGAMIHPRVYATATKILGRWVRERGLLTLEAAVRKLSGWPAERFGLKDRGVVREGAYADLVAFDPETVADRSTFEEPHQTSEGMPYVAVNGTLVVDEGRPVEELPGPPPGRALACNK